ncbi:myosin-2 essential light chain [Dermatophagoides farinae]|uniref:myosin-2 essential light chain n=1 Tax=Dermatophagoides farinae TaxID=6954 RepID=UPI003F62AFC3
MGGHTTDHVQYDQAQLEEIFQIFDTKGDGCIDVDQIGEVLRAMGQNPTEADIHRCSEPLREQQRDQRITFEVFMPIYQQISKNKDRYSFDDIVEGLRHFDTDGSGTIGAAELRHLLTALGEKLTEDEVEQLIDSTMIDDEGRINYETFVKAIMNG